MDEGQQPYKYCPLCDRKYQSMDALNEHVEAAHPEYESWNDDPEIEE